MADPALLEILGRGVEQWNRWIDAPDAPSPPRAEPAGAHDETIAAISEKLLPALRRAMLNSGIPNAEREIAAIRQNGLVSLLAEALAAGEVTVDLAEKSLRALCGELRAARVSVDDAKEGLLAADDTLRRLAIAGRESGRFRYRSGGNIARDLLIGFARSLHR